MISRLFILVAAVMLVCVPAFAQDEEVCDEAAQDALELCLEQAEANCLAAAPVTCEKPLLTIDEVRAETQGECGCSVVEEGGVATCSECTARNYGKYRSCVVKILKALKSTGIISQEVKAQILSENKLCRATIKEQKRKGKPEKE